MCTRQLGLVLALLVVAAWSAAAMSTKVFCAGATGRLGSRCVTQLTAQGLEVVAGVRQASMDKAKAALPAATTLVEYDLADEKSIARALDGCSTVVCALGALETEILNYKAPYLVDGVYTQNLIAAARATPSVRHFILVTSLGTAKFGLPASLLNLWWGVLVWKHKSELALQDSGLKWTIVRPGGMERPTDEYENTHNVRLARANSLFGGQVSRLQVAKLVAAAAANPADAASKVMEVVAETDAPLRAYTDLLSAFPASRSDAEWRAALSPLAYYVMREEGTERPWSSPLNTEKRRGVYACAGCGAPLFASDAKYESGTGWPSFFEPISEEAVTKEVDLKIGVPRVEVRCASCDSHGGHVFGDGPRPTGERYCMNGVALEFKPEE